MVIKLQARDFKLERLALPLGVLTVVLVDVQATLGPDRWLMPNSHHLATSLSHEGQCRLKNSPEQSTLVL